MTFSFTAPDRVAALSPPKWRAAPSPRPSPRLSPRLPHAGMKESDAFMKSIGLPNTNEYRTSQASLSVGREKKRQAMAQLKAAMSVAMVSPASATRAAKEPSAEPAWSPRAMVKPMTMAWAADVAWAADIAGWSLLGLPSCAVPELSALDAASHVRAYPTPVRPPSAAADDSCVHHRSRQQRARQHHRAPPRMDTCIVSEGDDGWSAHNVGPLMSQAKPRPPKAMDEWLAEQWTRRPKLERRLAAAVQVKVPLHASSRLLQSARLSRDGTLSKA